MKDIPLVAIKCIAYNHESYIRETLEGFVTQKTNFPFVAIVHDDASTDNTTSIIQEYSEKYPDVIKPIFETKNQYSKNDGSLNKIINSVLRSTGAKYIAICEGDDYWTDPFKLQKQVDFLEVNPNYGICYTKIRNFIQAKKKLGDIWGGPYQEFSELLIKGNTIPTLTAVFKSDLYFEYYKVIQPSDKKWPMGDYPMWLYFAHNSKVRFLDEVTGIYRVLPESASHMQDNNKWLRFCNGYRDIKLYYATYYNCLEKYQPIINNTHFRLILRRYAFDYNLKEPCCNALMNVKFDNYFKAHILRFMIKRKSGYFLLKGLYIIHDFIRH